MELSAKAVDVQDILAWRDKYRLEMGCQIIHDSLHSRKGWTEPYLLLAGGVTVGYGSIAVGGPWKGKPTVFEWYVAPQYRLRLFDLFHDKLTTAHSPPGAIVRRTTPEDAAQLLLHELDPEAHWVVEVERKVAAAGGVLFHYNRPYGDIYMKVAEPFRRRGLGSYLVQELKRVCYEQGNVPAARCNPTNIPSRKTLQKAGFVPCGHILSGTVSV